MAQKHVKVLLKEIKSYSLRLSEAEKAIQQATASAMVDPEIIEKATGLLKSVANYHQQIINCIYWAKDGNPKEYLALHGVTLRTINYLKDALKAVQEQTPDDPLVKTYQAQIGFSEINLEVLEGVKRKLFLPQAKRRYKAWEHRNMGFINEPFIPFLRLDQRLKTLEEFIEKEL